MDLKAILAQDDIVLPQKTIERAFRFPTFDVNETFMNGKVEYPRPGVGLMHNPCPREKKKPSKGGGGKSGSVKDTSAAGGRAKSPTRRR